MLPLLLRAMFNALLVAVSSKSITDPGLTCSAKPPNLPAGIETYQKDFDNWANTLHAEDLWTAVPKTPDDIVKLVNWALTYNYTVRPCSYRHNWSPLAVTSSTDCSRTLTIETKDYFKKMAVLPNGTASYPQSVVIADPGVTLQELLTELEVHGFGMTNVPAIGEVSLGGLFTIGGHGFSIKVAASPPHLKHYGSISNRIVAVTAVAWDNASKSYTLKTFDRSTRELSVMLTHLGQSFITSFTIAVEKNYLLRCISHVNIPNKEIFADPGLGKGLRTFSSFNEVTGRATIISYPYLDYSWIRQCSYVDSCPKESRVVTGPYNYPLLSGLPKWFSDYIATLLRPAIFTVPPLMNLEFELIKLGLNLAKSTDICGPSKNHMFYLHTNTLRYADVAYGILTKRSNIQTVISMVKTHLDSLLYKYKMTSQFPMNGFLGVRVNGVDDPKDIGPTARNSYLGSTVPDPAHPDFDVVVWQEFLFFSGTRYHEKFFTELESFILSTFDGTVGLSRPEWSKGWAVTDSGVWTNRSVLQDVFPNRYPGWKEFNCVRNTLDPNRLFRNELLEQMFPLTPNNPC